VRDLEATATVARLLRGLAADGLSVILVVHDLALAAAVVMDDGRTTATGAPRDVLTRERLQAEGRRPARRLA
jgi:iron complex transport system ATP-binding protein